VLYFIENLECLFTPPLGDIQRSFQYGNLGAIELRKKLKESHKVDVMYRRVYLGKQLAMDKIYDPWGKSFDNLYRFKAQIEESSLGSFVVIDHYTIDNKTSSFLATFFALISFQQYITTNCYIRR